MISEEDFQTMQPNLVIDAARPLSARKHRLFVCACCRRFWDLMEDERSRQSVEVAELYVDRQTSKAHLAVAYKEATVAENELRDREKFLPYHAARFASTWQIRKLTDEVSFSTAVIFVPAARGWDIDGNRYSDECKLAITREAQTQINMLRDVFTTPAFFDPIWRTSTVMDLAQAIYNARTFDTMQVLADALLDAGCDSDVIINHCRSELTHIRGCWLLDLILQKS